MCKVFEETAHQETGHAFAHLDLMYPADELTVEKLLEIAIEGELYETNHMYPGLRKQPSLREIRKQPQSSSASCRITRTC